MALPIRTALISPFRLTAAFTTAVLIGCSAPTPHTGSQSLMMNESGQSITFTLTPNRIGTPNTAHLDLTPEVMYFVPQSQIVRENTPNKTSDDSSQDNYQLSVAFNTEEAGRVTVECNATYHFGYVGICSTTVDNEKYTGPMRHYPEID